MSIREEIETRVRTLAHSMPPSDVGSTRAIYGVVDLILSERADAAEKAAAELRDALRGAISLLQLADINVDAFGGEEDPEYIKSKAIWDADVQSFRDALAKAELKS